MTPVSSIHIDVSVAAPISFRTFAATRHTPVPDVCWQWTSPKPHARTLPPRVWDDIAAQSVYVIIVARSPTMGPPTLICSMVPPEGSVAPIVTGTDVSEFGVEPVASVVARDTRKALCPVNGVHISTQTVPSSTTGVSVVDPDEMSAPDPYGSPSHSSPVTVIEV